MRMSPRARLLGFGTAGVLAVATVAGTGAVLAQESGSDPAPGDHEFAPDQPHPARHGRGLMGSIINASGLDPAVFKEGFSEGKTINEILAENGVDADAVKGQVVADFETRLDDLMDKVPNPDERPGPGPGQQRPGNGHIGNIFGIAADVIGTDPAELAAAMREGATLASLAEANGVSPQAVIDALLEPAFARVDEAVANGRIDEEKAAELKANATEKVTNLVYNGPPERPTHEPAEAS